MRIEDMNDQQAWYYKVLRIRRIEQRIAMEYAKQEMRCPVHLSIGQEGAAVAIMDVLLDDDLVVSSHRGHAHYLAKGGNLNALIAELYGKDGGCSRGYGSSMHLVDRACGFYGSTSIVGGTVPLGVGLAFAKKLRKEKGIVVICFGDGAIEEGVFHEAANFAGLHKLPIVFYMENNLYSCYTHLRDRQPISLNRYRKIAHAHDLQYRRVMCHLPTSRAVMYSIRGNMEIDPCPWLIEAPTYRYVEHCGPRNDDDLKYRPMEEIAQWLERDPVWHASFPFNFPKEFMEAIEQKIETEVDEAFKFAKESPFPEWNAHGFEYAAP